MILKSINKLFIFLIFCSSLFFSQGIKISVLNEKKELVKNGKAFLFEGNNETYTDFALIRQGKILIIPTQKYQNLRVKIVADGYLSEEKVISNYQLANEYDLEFQLKKDVEFKIEEIVINKRKPIVVKKDTVTFHVERFSDGTEVKLEDILKKLPGIDVDEASGSIKYKGKSIETLTLNGDNLFGNNYTIGTKSINYNIIDQIEAIENFQTNPLLQKVNRNNKVSLNVKLKQKILDVSGSVGYRSGYFGDKKEAYDIGADLISLYDGLKSYTTLQYNNIGNSDHFNFSTEDSDVSTKRFLEASIRHPSVPMNRWNFNDRILGSTNLIYKFSPSANLKLNYSFIKDIRTYNESSESSYNTDWVSVKNISSAHSQESFFENFINGELTSMWSATNRLHTIFSYNFLRDSHAGTYGFNENENFKNLNYQRNFAKSQINYTQVLGNDDVLDFFLKLNFYQGKENQTFIPVQSADELHSQQDITIQKKSINFYGDYYKTIKGIHLKQTIGWKFQHLDLDSYLKENTIWNNEENLVYFRDQKLYSATKLKYNYNKWSFETIFNWQQRALNYHNDTDSWQKNRAVLGNQTEVFYVVGSKDVFSAQYEWVNKPLTENYLFNRYIRTSYNTINKNLINDGFQKEHTLGLKYWHNDFEKQYLIQSFFNFGWEKGQYFSDLNINSDIISTLYFYQPIESWRVLHNFSLTKLLFPLKTKVKINTFFTNSTFYNIINAEERKVNLRNFNLTFGLKSSFSAKFRLENETTFGFLNYNSGIEFKNQSFQNKFTLVVHPKSDLSFISEWFTYKPNQNANTYYHFWDVSFRMLPIKKSYSLSFSLKNILNESVFTNSLKTDYSQFVQTVPLFPFHIMLGGGLQF